MDMSCPRNGGKAGALPSAYLPLLWIAMGRGRGKESWFQVRVLLWVPVAYDSGPYQVTPDPQGLMPASVREGEGTYEEVRALCPVCPFITWPHTVPSTALPKGRQV